jgi:hypothetical protein
MAAIAAQKLVGFLLFLFMSAIIIIISFSEGVSVVMATAMAES